VKEKFAFFHVTLRQWSHSRGRSPSIRKEVATLQVASTPRRAAALSGMPSTVRCFFHNSIGSVAGFSDYRSDTGRNRRNWSTWTVQQEEETEL
jgi:hypothetical protein